MWRFTKIRQLSQSIIWGRLFSGNCQIINCKKCLKTIQRNFKLEVVTSVSLSYVALLIILNYWVCILVRLLNPKKFCVEESQNNLEKNWKKTWNELIWKRRFRLCLSEKSWIHLLYPFSHPFNQGFLRQAYISAQSVKGEKYHMFKCVCLFLSAETLPSMSLSFFCAFDTA